MILDLDIYRSANVLMKHHGQDAPIEAAMRADEMLEKGDLGGCALAHGEPPRRSRVIHSGFSDCDLTPTREIGGISWRDRFAH